MENVQMVTTPAFKLTPNELRAMYVRMAMCQFAYLRNPNYNEDMLLKKLTAEFKAINSQLIDIVDRDKNNHTMRKAASFFDNHYKNLLAIEN